MKAFIVDRYGKGKPLRAGDVPEPDLRDDEVPGSNARGLLLFFFKNFRFSARMWMKRHSQLRLLRLCFVGVTLASADAIAIVSSAEFSSDCVAT